MHPVPGQASEMGLLLGQLQQQWGVKKQQICELQQKQRVTSELRAAGSEIRNDADRYMFGLLKVHGTW